MNPNYALTTLPNGLRIATEYMPGVHSAAITVSVGAGSRCESAEQSGLSHVLEHMAFKGTKRRNAQQIAEEFEDIGGNFNAYTSVDNTVYYARILADHLPKAAELLADILQHSLLDEAELTREKKVILQEIAAHKDSPEDYINDLFDAVAYADQPLGRSILGNEQTVTAFTRQQVADYIDQHYHAENIVISAAGRLTHEAFVELIERQFSAITSRTPTPFASATYRGGRQHHAKDLEQTHILFGFPAPHQHHEDYYTSQLLASILGGGMSSRLFQEIREKRGLVYHLASYNVAYVDAAMLMMAAACAPEHAQDIPELMQHELEKLAKHISPAELTRAKNQLLTELAMARENSSSVASWIGRHLLTYDDYRSIEHIASRLNAISLQDVQQLAASTVKQNSTLVSLGKS